MSSHHPSPSQRNCLEWRQESRPQTRYDEDAGKVLGADPGGAGDGDDSCGYAALLVVVVRTHDDGDGDADGYAPAGSGEDDEKS